LFMIANSGFAQKTALHFDGVNDYVPITGTTRLNSLTRITVETWLYVTNFASSPCADCAPVIWNQQNSYRLSTGNTKKVNIAILNGSTTVTLTSATTLNANTWHHIAATFNGTRLKLYIDGKPTDSATYSTFNIGYGSTSSDVWIVDPVTGFGGTLEETRIWDHARTASQIQEGMIKHYPTNQPGLVLQLSYEDGAAYSDNSSVSTVADNSGYNHNGTPTNFALADSVSNFVLGRDYCDTIAYATFSASQCSRYQLPSKKKMITVSGVYQDTIVSWRGCDSVMTITVKILKTSTATVNLSGCDSVQNPVTKNYYKNSGKYTLNLLNSVGCDSAISYFVTVYKKDTTRLSYDACNSIVLANGKTFTSSGVYVDSLKGIRGCDSFVIRTIKIRKSTFAQSTLTMCKFVLCPTSPTVVYRKPGIYYDTIPNTSNCDSVIEYTVVSTATSGIVNIASCGSYKSPSQKYTWTVSGTYYDTLLFGNSVSCDSFITINLSISTPTKKTLFITACNSYVVPSGTKTITSSDSVYDVIKSKNGCDSIQYTLHVTINRANANFVQIGNTLTATTASGSATFKWLDCDNQYAAIPGETNKNFVPAKDGNYALAVTENSCTDTSNCVSFKNIGTRSLSANNITVFPNPTRGIIGIKSATALHQVKITIMSTTGQILKTWELGELTRVNLYATLPAAVNWILIESAEGNMVQYLVFE
jgi:hypothetical protein